MLFSFEIHTYLCCLGCETTTKQSKQHSKEHFLQKLPDSLGNIEKAWVSEVDSNKRERGK